MDELAENTDHLLVVKERAFTPQTTSAQPPGEVLRTPTLPLELLPRREVPFPTTFL